MGDAPPAICSKNKSERTSSERDSSGRVRHGSSSFSNSTSALKAWREEPKDGGNNGIDVDRVDTVSALWLRPLLWIVESFLGLAVALSENSSLKLLHAVLDSIYYSFIKIPFAIRSYLRRAHGSRVWRNCAYGPRERNRLDVYLPDPELGVGRFGNAVILFVHGCVALPACVLTLCWFGKVWWMQYSD